MMINDYKNEFVRTIVESIENKNNEITLRKETYNISQTMMESFVKQKEYYENKIKEEQLLYDEKSVSFDDWMRTISLDTLPFGYKNFSTIFKKGLSAEFNERTEVYRLKIQILKNAIDQITERLK